MNSNVVRVPIAHHHPRAISLRVSHLTLTLGGNRVLSDVEFTLPQTGITSFIGPSGAGKSSLLRCLNMLHHDWQGEITIFHHNVRQWPSGEDALRRTVGLIVQTPSLFPCSIVHNLLFGLSRRARKQIATDRIEQVLRQAALWEEVRHRLDDRASTLSVGQQQRLCIARALALSPSMLLLDEPTASLDPHSKQCIEVSLLALAERMPIVCVTHDLEQAKRLAGHTLFMCDGRIIEQGDADTFFNQPQRLESREFLRWSVCDCA